MFRNWSDGLPADVEVCPVQFPGRGTRLMEPPFSRLSLLVEALAEALHRAPGEGWLRGIGYHDGIADRIDRTWLDRHGPDRPIRIQHRGGRMWIL